MVWIGVYKIFRLFLNSKKRSFFINLHYICTMFKQRVQKFIDESGLLMPGEKVLVALSGGADSVALFRVLIAMNYPIEAAHCNFHLRGEESNRDESFVRSLCEDFGVTLHVTHFDTTAYAKERGISIEMAARELRYEWFGQLCVERGIETIAVAHHRDDSVETFLLNLIRGTGINGLKGIAPKNGHIVRPLLMENRTSIEEYLQAIKQDYVTDSTNLQDEYMRNKIRLNILPLMKELNPSVSDSIFRTSRRLNEVADIYNRERARSLSSIMIKEPDGSFRISIDGVRKDIAPESLLHEALSRFGFHSAQVEDMLRCIAGEQSGKRFYAREWMVLRDREYLIVKKVITLDELPELVIEESMYTPDFQLAREKDVACIDADKVKGELTVRRWEQGDKFVPFGMTGKKKVSDYLTDRKFTLYEKEKQCVVCCGDDIVWVVNERSDNRYRVTENTKRIYILSVK